MGFNKVYTKKDDISHDGQYLYSFSANAIRTVMWSLRMCGGLIPIKVVSFEDDDTVVSRQWT